eukprot:gene17720-20187_t
MSTCDQIEVEACPMHDTVTDNAPSCDEPITVEVDSVDVAEVEAEQLPLTEEQKGELQVLEEVPEDICDTGDVGGNSHQGSSEEQESLAAEVVPGEDLELSCKVVEQDDSAVTESETKSTENSGDVIPVEICSEDHAQGEEQPSKVDESAQEITTPQQRKLARLAQREGKEKETMVEKDAQSTIAESDFDSSTILNDASANQTHETQDTAPVASSTEGEATNKPRKLNSKQRKARNKRLEAEKASASGTADTVEKAVNSLSAPVAASPVTVATM